MKKNNGERKTSLVVWIIIAFAAAGLADLVILLIKMFFGHGKY